MSTVVADAFAARELFTGLFDDAALFPPGNAPMVRAVPAHLAYHERPDAELIGPFLCPASRLAELRSTLADDAYIDVQIIVDTGIAGLEDALAAVTRDDHDPSVFQEHGFEIALRAEADLGTAARRLVAAIQALDQYPVSSTYVEVPIAATASDALDVLAEYDVAAKLRTGGTQASAYPTEEQVADFIVGCLDREIGFKCTAGLHHAVRNTDPDTGFEQHGFLNILLAVSVALAGGDREMVAAELADRHAIGVAARVRRLSPDRARTIRRWFRSMGTCSIQDPIDDLILLGLVDDHSDRVAEQPA